MSDNNFNCKKGVFNLEKNKYMQFSSKDKQKYSSINEAINDRLNIKIENMSINEVKELLETKLEDKQEKFYYNCLYALEGIKCHLEALQLAAMEADSIGNMANMFKGERALYKSLSIICNRFSEISCSLLALKDFNSKNKIINYTLDDYNNFVLPVIEYIITIIRYIEGDKNKKEYTELPIILHTTDLYFGVKNLIFKIEVNPKAIDWSLVITTALHIHNDYADRLISDFTKCSNSFMEKMDIERSKKEASKFHVYKDEFLNNGVIANVISGVGEVVVSAAGTVAAVETGNVAVAATSGAKALKGSVNIFTKITGTASKANSAAAKLTAVATNAARISTVTRCFNYAAYAVTAIDAGKAAYCTHKRLKRNNVIDDIYFKNIDEEIIKNVICFKIYRSISFKVNK